MERRRERAVHHHISRSLCLSIAPSVVLLLLAAVYLWLLRPQLARPYMYDDVNFAFAARAVADTGLPYANAGHMSDRWDFSRREQWALWHPPLYIELLGLQFKLFGTSETSGRLLGAAFGLATAARLYFDSLANNSNLRWSLDGPPGNVVANRSFNNSDSQSFGNPYQRMNAQRLFSSLHLPEINRMQLRTFSRPFLTHGAALRCLRMASPTIL